MLLDSFDFKANLTEIIEQQQPQKNIHKQTTYVTFCSQSTFIKVAFLSDPIFEKTKPQNLYRIQDICNENYRWIDIRENESKKQRQEQQIIPMNRAIDRNGIHNVKSIVAL